MNPGAMSLRIGGTRLDLTGQTALRLTVSRPTVTEGEQITLTFKISNFLTGTAQVNWAITANAGSIVAPTSGVATFTAGTSSSFTVTLTTKADVANPDDRIAVITMSNPLGCIVSDPTLSFDILKNVGLPLISVVPVTATIKEGGSSLFRVARSKTTADCTVGYLATGASGDLSGTLNNQITFTGQQTSKLVGINTVDRSGTQGERDLNIALSVVSGCTLAAGGADRATMRILDKTPADQWWNTERRSGLAWNSGVAYWPTVADLNQYQREVHKIDVICGDNGGTSEAHLATWNKLAGGDPATPDTIQDDSQMDWSSLIGNFTAAFNSSLPDTTWFIFAIKTMPTSFSSALNKYIWQDISNGDFDDHYYAMGVRARANMLAKGRSLDKLVLRPNHEFNTVRYYQVFPGPTTSLTAMIDQRAHYREAMKRFANQFRRGYGQDIKIIFAPHAVTTAEHYLGTFGNIYSETYTNHLSETRDVYNLVDLTLHGELLPANETEFNQMMNGTLFPNSYGFIPTQISWAASHSIPICHSGWSPRYASEVRCPIPDDFYEYVHDHFVAYSASLAFECVFNRNTLSSSTNFGANWPAGVTKYKTLWSGNKAT